MAPILAVSPVSARIAEIESRFQPARVSKTSSNAPGASSTIDTSSFGSVLADLLTAESGSDATGSGIDLTKLTTALRTAQSRSLTPTQFEESTPRGPSGTDAVDAAKKYLGVPYVWGGTNPAKGLDCSGLVQRAYRDIGIELPRVSYDQAKVGTEVPSIAQAKPGDLIAFGSPVNHIAIYVGDGKIIQAPRTGDVVKISDIKRPIATIRRVIPDSNIAATSTATPTTSSSGIAGAEPFEQMFQQSAARYGLNPRLLAAVAKTESNFNPSATSGAGAQGLMQFMPATARGLGIDPRDPAQAIDGAARYLSTQLDRFGSIDLALAAYNAGPGAVQRYGGVPPYNETRNYVSKVLNLMNGQSPVTGART